MATEKQIEAKLKKEVEKRHGICYKFMSPGRANVPDRICALPNGVVFFVECKGDGGRLRSGQVRELTRLRDMNHNAYYIADYQQLHAVLWLMDKEIEHEKRST